jgi:monosaccharide-transporting ATPase
MQQMVAIARALDVSARLLVLDEPTSSLDEKECEELFGIMRKLRGEGLGIVFVTHFLDQVYAVSDRITVLRNGQLVGEYATRGAVAAAAGRAMLGKRGPSVEAEQAGAVAPRPRSRRAVAGGPRPRPARLHPAGGPGHPPARCWGWPGCWAPAAPRRRGCCSAPTVPTAERSA